MSNIAMLKYFKKEKLKDWLVPVIFGKFKA